ncbi:5-formyltetrahydrofolate cyclo-ligase [Rhodohalobacter sp. 8-1]|uniref:5-formyltetrahydrofolate cyclo-ligase n=1 Tax=Rhodohalobacter sp. 8-1 TaxID=3131972 RepID=UPI0030ED3478
MKISLPEQKLYVRQHHQTIRKSLLPGEWKQKSQAIIHRLMSSRMFISSESIHTYVSIEKSREVYTIDFIRSCIDAGKEVIVPRMKSGGELSHHKITSIDSLSKNKWGVYEPTGDSPVNLPEHLLVIVPMVAADFQLNRLGYGKGYYDRFLGSVTSTKVGLCFNCNLSLEPLPSEPWDIKMDTIITNQFVLQMDM